MTNAEKRILAKMRESLKRAQGELEQMNVPTESYINFLKTDTNEEIEHVLKLLALLEKE